MLVGRRRGGGGGGRDGGGRSPEHLGRLRRQPIEQVTRFHEAAGVRLGAQNHHGYLWSALRQPQERRQAVARLTDETGLPCLHIHVTLHDEAVRAVHLDR